MKHMLRIAAAALFFPIAAAAQKPAGPDPFLDHMAGKWVMQGTIAGQQTTHDVTAEWVLEYEYLRLHEVSREKQPNGLPAYEAIVFFGIDPKTHEYGVLWLDNTAAAAFPPEGVGRGKLDGNRLPLLFGSGENVFHNTMVYDSATDSWQWIMDNDDHGALKPFARLTLRR